MNGSGKALCRVIAMVPVWMIELNLPPRVAPMATRCSVVVRPPTIRYTPSRDKAVLTGRPVSFAAAAPST